MKTTKKKRIFRLSGRIDQSLYERFEDFCLQAPIHDPTQYIYIPIYSPGGDLGWSSMIVEKMKTFSAHIITVSYYMVHSSAVPVFAAGTIRLAERPTDKFLFHRATKAEVLTNADLASGERSAFEYIAERMNQQPETIYHLAEVETRLDAIQAKELGLVHKILTSSV